MSGKAEKDFNIPDCQINLNHKTKLLKPFQNEISNKICPKLLELQISLISFMCLECKKSTIKNTDTDYYKKIQRSIQFRCVGFSCRCSGVVCRAG